jgi:hypothetical protein
MMEKVQAKLSVIVRGWKLNDKPEFREFHCGLCQDLLIFGAWHYLLHVDGYLTPVHLCEYCKERFGNGEIVENLSSDFDRSSFRPTFSPKTEAVLDCVVKRWDIEAPPSYRMFSCDACHKPLENARSWHVWRSKKGVLIECHFCRRCWAKILR